MGQNIKTLIIFAPPVSDDEIHAAAPFRRGLRNRGTLGDPENGSAFQAAVDAVAADSITLVRSLETNTPPRDREIELAWARARNARRFLVTPQPKD